MVDVRAADESAGSGLRVAGSWSVAATAGVATFSNLALVANSVGGLNANHTVTFADATHSTVRVERDILVTECFDGENAGGPNDGIVCRDCAAGQFYDAETQLKCLQCPQGRFSNVSRSRSCTACPAGSFNNKRGLPFCTLCPVGHISTEPGAQFCEPCNVGTYQAGLGTTECVDCEVGRFSSVRGVTSCSFCSPGRFTNQVRKGFGGWG